ncbi:MAG: hypothetical protein JST28_18810 [Acidobacteria bacterium]|nr:hypothetical protein [Acidobacteriota bacterium]
MKSQGHAEIYRVAFDVAQVELAEITAEFERLRVRKEHVERLILALKPVIGEPESPTPVASKEEPAEVKTEELPSKAEPSGDESAQPLGVGADPFQRRVDHVLGIGAGIRDVRQYTRQF